MTTTATQSVRSAPDFRQETQFKLPQFLLDDLPTARCEQAFRDACSHCIEDAQHKTTLVLGNEIGKLLQNPTAWDARFTANNC
jgi:hypothetical protein